MASSSNNPPGENVPEEDSVVSRNGTQSQEGNSSEYQNGGTGNFNLANVAAAMPVLQPPPGLFQSSTVPVFPVPFLRPPILGQGENVPEEDSVVSRNGTQSMLFLSKTM
ncbi:uncharacterized protein LOC122503257 [Leptopilina heterotoma]|uniref:uncharacterized protein LOC122503257 n=1 Tax=Leptopilina heterotoma TaxID=63436 RepID=UPI001CA971A4|nr:uncharacterized protein LOC122503257 [Leptopilina heterotoma]